jgi:hypothetical protein
MRQFCAYLIASLANLQIIPAVKYGGKLSEVNNAGLLQMIHSISKHYIGRPVLFRLHGKFSQESYVNLRGLETGLN